jgi:hypothetical protein
LTTRRETKIFSSSGFGGVGTRLRAGGVRKRSSRSDGDFEPDELLDDEPDDDDEDEEDEEDEEFDRELDEDDELDEELDDFFRSFGRVDDFD